MKALNSKLLPSTKRLQLIFGIVATVLFASSIVLPILYLRFLNLELQFLGSLLAVFLGYLAATLLLAADRKIAVGIGSLFILASLYPAYLLIASLAYGGASLGLGAFFLGPAGLFGLFGGMLAYKGSQKPPTAKKVARQRSPTIWQKLRSTNILSLVLIAVIAFGIALVIQYWVASVYWFFK